MMLDLDHYATKPDSKLRKVLEVLADGRWHSAVALHEAEGGFGWTFDSCLSQLRRKGLTIESRPTDDNGIAGGPYHDYRLDVKAAIENILTEEAAAAKPDLCGAEPITRPRQNTQKERYVPAGGALRRPEGAGKPESGRLF